jgi:hypothetical protein
MISQPVSVIIWNVEAGASGRNAATTQNTALNDTTITVSAPPMSCR